MERDERPAADEIAGRISAQGLASLLDALKGGRAAFEQNLNAAFEQPTGPTPRDSEAFPRRTYGLLKFLSDDLRSLPHWQALAQRSPSGLSREDAIFGLWSLFEKEPDGHQYIERKQLSPGYHRHRFFEWFLGRYDLRRARRTWMAQEGWLVPNAHFLLLLALGAIAGLHLAFPAPALAPGGHVAPRWTMALVAAVYLVVVALQVHAFRGRTATAVERLVLACQSLIPRVAAASVVGLVILASSQEMLGFVVRGASAWRVAVLLAASFGYLLLEMARRVQPLPSLRHLFRSGLDVTATALAHSLAIALGAERALQWLLARSAALNGWQLLNVAAFLLAIGLIVNLIWAEEPVTKPL